MAIGDLRSVDLTRSETLPEPGGQLIVRPAYLSATLKRLAQPGQVTTWGMRLRCDCYC
jgi:hypothetical protein